MSCGFEPMYDTLLITTFVSGFAMLGLMTYKFGFKGDKSDKKESIQIE